MVWSECCLFPVTGKLTLWIPLVSRHSMTSLSWCLSNLVQGPCFEYLTTVDTYTPRGDGSLLPIFLLYLLVSLDRQYYGWKPITVLSAATTPNTSFLLKQISVSCTFDIPFYFGFNDWFGVFHKWISGAWYSCLSCLIYESYTDFHLL